MGNFQTLPYFALWLTSQPSFQWNLGDCCNTMGHVRKPQQCNKKVQKDPPKKECWQSQLCGNVQSSLISYWNLHIGEVAWKKFPEPAKYCKLSWDLLSTLIEFSERSMPTEACASLWIQVCYATVAILCETHRVARKSPEWLPQQKKCLACVHPIPSAKHYSKLLQDVQDLQDYSETNSLMPFSGDK